MKKSFIFVMQNLYPIIGGAEQSIATLITQLRKRGHPVSYVCTENYSEDLVNTIEYHDIVVTQLNWAAVTINRAEQFNKPSIVFIRSLENVCRKVYEDPKFLSECEQRCKPCPHKITGYEEHGRALRKASLILGNSKWTSKLFKEEHNLRSKYIYPFIDFDYYSNVELKERKYIAMNKWSWADGAEIFINIARKMPKHQFKIVGYEALHSDRPLPPNVKYTGVSEDAQEVYGDVKIWLYPNLHGTFGRVAIEAQLAGIPVIGAARGPVLEDNMTPYTVKNYRNPQAWKQEILKVIKNKSPPMTDFSNFETDVQIEKFIRLAEAL